jgi:tyrosyl-tRNA synthetase
MSISAFHGGLQWLQPLETLTSHSGFGAAISSISAGASK